MELLRKKNQLQSSSFAAQAAKVYRTRHSPQAAAIKPTDSPRHLRKQASPHIRYLSQARREEAHNRYIFSFVLEQMVLLSAQV